MESIKTLFTTEDIAEMKQAMKGIIVEQFRHELNQLDVYLFDPSVINDLIQETYEEIMSEIKVELKDKMLQKMEKATSEMK